MDDNQTPNEPNLGLAEAYQSILDKYSQELAVAAPPELPPEVPLLITPPPSKPNNFFKIIFFFSLLVFLSVLVANVYVFFLAKPASPTAGQPTLIPNPTANVANYCALNDLRYVVDQTFPAQDGCNTCTCLTDLTISCTNNVCPTAGPTKKPVPLTVSSIYPTSGKIGTKVTIYGTGFDKTANNISFTSTGCTFNLTNQPSTDGQKIIITLTQPTDASCSTETAGTYTVSVNNSTKSVKFTITGTTATPSATTTP
ncbi:MAG: hypothetical protein NTY75_04965 [Candidatus Shapirobacteria bacterium]|nr:hypothetical protein [Candidatus Shapirobacteria bacterium]